MPNTWIYPTAFDLQTRRPDKLEKEDYVYNEVFCDSRWRASESRRKRSEVAWIERYI